MIFSYSSPEFENLKIRLIEIFTSYQNDEKYKDLITIFLNVLTNDFDKLKLMDNFNLSFNSWDDVNRAINSNLLSEENLELLNFKSNREVNTYDFINIFDSFYLTLYADIYEASLTSEDGVFDSFYSTLHKSLQFNYPILNLK